MLGLRNGTLHIHQNGGRGLTEATRTLAILADPDTRLDTQNPTNGSDHQSGQVATETAVDDHPEAVQANQGVICPQTNISVHVTHHNVGDADTTTERATTATGQTDEDGADEDRATASANEAREINDFILGALESVADFQKQESRELMETLGKTLVHGIRAMKAAAQPR